MQWYLHYYNDLDEGAGRSGATEEWFGSGGRSQVRIAQPPSPVSHVTRS